MKNPYNTTLRCLRSFRAGIERSLLRKINRDAHYEYANVRSHAFGCLGSEQIHQTFTMPYNEYVSYVLHQYVIEVHSIMLFGILMRYNRCIPKTLFQN